ncbi:MAG: FHA domain-containing protein [Actinomycetota bacterium]
MSDQLLLILRVGLLALVYLTFFRVLRAVWVELRTESRVVVAAPLVVPASNTSPAPVSATATPPAGAAVDGGGLSAARLVVLAPAPLAGTVFDLQTETTIGRAAGCGVMVDDPRVSKLHARLFHSGGRWVVEDLGSTNGTLLNGNVLDLAKNVGPGDRIQVGEHVLELV